MIKLQVLSVLICVLAANGVNLQNGQVPKESRNPGTTRQTTKPLDREVMRALEFIDSMQRQAPPGTMFSYATREIENCTDICQDGHHLTGSCGKACRDFYAMEKVKEENRQLKQYVDQQNREYSKGIYAVIGVFSAVILIQCIAFGVTFKYVRDEITRTNRDTQAMVRKELEDKMDQQRIYMRPVGDHDHTATAEEQVGLVHAQA